MESASSQTYLSKRAMDLYAKKRKEQMSNKKAKTEDVIGPKKAQKDELLQTIKEENVIMKDEAKAEAEEEDDVRSMESVNSDELEGDMNLSDNDEEEAQIFRHKKMIEKKKVRAGPARKFEQEIDTNVFKINFSTLANKAELATGDPEFCKECKAILNMHSKIEENKAEENQIWICEFCLNRNVVDIEEEEEKPKTNAVNYLVEAAAQIQDKKAKGQKATNVVFCIDQSGSMCCSQAVQGKFSIKGDKRNQMKDLLKFGDGSEQFLDGEGRNVTYVSRMQCLQAAIEHQISDMKNGAKDRKIGIVSFNNEVTVVGDGSEDPQIIGGDKLNDYEYLMKNGAEQSEIKLKKTIEESHKKLTDKLMSIEENGATALGPAIATSIAMAAEGPAGSQVVICTDGLANVGVGNFDDAKTEEELAKVEEFYEKVGQYAKSKGLTINIVSIIGDECNLESLSKLADMTGGEIERVDPVSLTKNFANILSNPIIASNVIAKVKLHKGLQFRNENDANLSADKSLMVRDVGNVTNTCEITFEYTLKKISDLLKMEDFDLTNAKSLPFQLQIEYTDLEGNKCVRVITNTQDISTDRNQVENNAKFNVIGAHVTQKGAEMAIRGGHREAQAYAKGWNRKMKAVTNNAGQMAQRAQFVDQMKDVYDLMGQQDNMEQSSMRMQSSAMPGSMPMPGSMAMPMSSVMNGSSAKRSKMSDNYAVKLAKAKKGKK